MLAAGILTETTSAPASTQQTGMNQIGGKLNSKNIFQNPVSFNWCPPFSSSLRFKLNIYNSPLLFNCLLSELSISTEDLGSYSCLLTILMWDGALIVAQLPSLSAFCQKKWNLFCIIKLETLRGFSQSLDKLLYHSV